MTNPFSAITQIDRAAFDAINHCCRNGLFDWLMPRATDAGLGHVQAIVALSLAAVAAVWAGRLQWRRALLQGGVAGGVAAIVALALRMGGTDGMRRATSLGVLPADGAGTLLLLAIVFGTVLWLRFAWEGARAERRWVGPLLVALVVSGLASTAMKRVYRDRPWWYYEQQHQIGQDLFVTVATVPGVYPLKACGFPSGHTTTTVAMATVVTILFRRRRRGLVALAWLAAITVGYSRMYLGSHWPLDVLGGIVLGVATGIGSVWACRAWARSNEPQAAETAEEAG